MAELFDQTKIGNMVLKNRFVRSATVDNGGEEGHVTDGQIGLFKDWARGGIGLIITGMLCPDEEDHNIPAQNAIYDDRFIPGLKKLADVIHAGGAKANMQMAPHRGRTDEEDPASPSGIPHPFAQWSDILSKHPRVITVADLEEMAEYLGNCTRRVMEAGFDGIQIHSANGYMQCE